MLGSIKWFSDERGYGFITRDDGAGDVFVHFSAIVGQEGRRTLEKGQRVKFAVGPGRDGAPAATDVEVTA